MMPLRDLGAGRVVSKKKKRCRGRGDFGGSARCTLEKSPRPLTVFGVWPLAEACMACQLPYGSGSVLSVDRAACMTTRPF